MGKITLSGMPEPMLQPLYARAKESQTHGAIHDDTAVRLVQQLDCNFDFSSKDAAMHNGVIARALVLDKLVSTYLAQHPGAVVLLGPQRAAGGPAGPGGVIQSGGLNPRP